MKLRQGNSVSTAAITEENFQKVIDAFRMSGCKINAFFNAQNVKYFSFLEWHLDALCKTNEISNFDLLLTVEQILGADDKPHFDFSRRPDSGSHITPAPQWNELDLLPPVGAECEIAASTEYLTIGYPEGTKVKIYANFTDDRGVKLAAFVDSIGKVGGVATAKCFRPLKSERERAIEEIIEVISKSDGTFQSVAEKLYDAGFRKEGK